jgi:Peptidase A4 family
MIRRWCIPLVTIALVFGSLMAAGTASAAVTAHPATTHVLPASWVHGFRPGGLMKRGSGAQAQARGAANADQSTNWSGYAATGANGAFRSVSATWTEPTATCSGRTAKYSSFWVGLDGFNSGSVEQTGTDADCSGATPVYYGWYEMYPAFPVNFSNTVTPGDSMSASVTFSGTRTFTLVLKDTSRGWTQTITKSQSGLARSSAEVITEAPSSQSGVLPLANFGTVRYGSSTANGAGLGGQSPTEIIMINNSGTDKDSTSSISTGGAFSNTWLRSS